MVDKHLIKFHHRRITGAWRMIKSPNYKRIGRRAGLSFAQSISKDGSCKSTRTVKLIVFRFHSVPANDIKPLQSNYVVMNMTQKPGFCDAYTIQTCILNNMASFVDFRSQRHNISNQKGWKGKQKYKTKVKL